MNKESVDAHPLTSVELLDAAVWREIGSEEPQPASAFLEALSRLVGRWLLVRSDAPEMDAVTVLCKARGYIAQQRCHANKRGRVELVNQDLAFKRAIARRPGAQQRPCNKTRVLAAGLVIALLLVGGAIAAGLRINGTHSFPVGLYLARRKKPEKGDLVFVNAPALPIFALAKERGYLSVAYSAAPHLLKRLAGVAGDRVTIDSTGVQVNGIRLANSVPRHCDGAGRPLQACLLKDHILGPDEVLLMSDYNPASFDSRYFGPLKATTIESVIAPLLTWN